MLVKIYTDDMKIFAKITPAPQSRTKDSVKIAFFYAAILVIMVLAQLFTFEKFLVLLEDLSMPGGVSVARLVGGLLVSCEILALPFLLMMDLSQRMRVLSMVLGWVVPVIWLKLSVWVLVSGNMADNIGFLGTAIKFSAGWPSLLISIALGILAAWASWGLWPIRPKKVER
jgi:hypothetical protein